jgi:prepilin peptidase CpaA
VINVELIISVAFCLLLIAAALQDMRELRIDNKFPLALAGLFAAHAILFKSPSDVVQNLLVFIIAFAVCLPMFIYRLLGGGDVKLFAAVALWFDFSSAPEFALSVALFGALVTIVLISARRILPIPPAARENWQSLAVKGPIPYGLAIVAGALWSLPIPS